MWGWDPQGGELQWRHISDVGRRWMWGDVGLGPQSGRLIMEADKGCGAEGVVGRRWGDVGRMWGWDPQVVVLQWRQIRDVGRRWGDVG